MTFTNKPSSLRTINDDDPKFVIYDGLMMAKRAGFEISNDCPNQYKDIITLCINMRWLKLVATVKDNELFWEEFSK